MQFIPFEEPSNRPMPPETVQFSAPTFTPDAASAPPALMRLIVRMAATAAVLPSFIRNSSALAISPSHAPLEYPPKLDRTQCGPKIALSNCLDPVKTDRGGRTSSLWTSKAEWTV